MQIDSLFKKKIDNYIKQNVRYDPLADKKGNIIKVQIDNIVIYVNSVTYDTDRIYSIIISANHSSLKIQILFRILLFASCIFNESYF